MSLVVAEKVVDCQAEPIRLWPIVSDTERLNRAVGLGRLEVRPNDDSTAARYLVKTVSGGFPLEYEELPFEWEQPRRFSVKRIVRRGLVRSVETTFELASRPGGGTRLAVRVAAEATLRVLAPVMKLQMSRLLSRMVEYMKAADRELGSTSLALAAPHRGRSELGHLERVAEELVASASDEERPIARRLVELVRHAPDLEVDRIRPFELADRWNVDRKLVLSTCLHAVTSGLLELTWDLVCPSCRTATERMRTLAKLEAHAHCQLCDISFDMDLDQAVEATFRPARGVRTVNEGPYCIGGPARTPHVLAQAVLPGNGSVELRAPDEPGRYRLFVRGGAASILHVTDAGARELRAEVEADRLEPGAAELVPGARIEVSQRDERERHVKLERVDYARAAATAHHVSMLPEFRRQFAREVLRPGLTLRVSRVALLFTDLTGSTALYTAVGDAKAFGVVQDHFELLGRIIAEHEGTIVKTIGDAVMAAFLDEEDAVRAAVEMLRVFPEFRSAHLDAAELRLKVGVYAGACYAVTANGALDYFGQSVNVAARLQGAAGPGEVVIPAELAGVARGAGWIDPSLVARRFDAELKGLASPLTAERIEVDAPQASSSG